MVRCIRNSALDKLLLGSPPELERGHLNLSTPPEDATRVNWARETWSRADRGLVLYSM
jgi:hypothetical protein